MSIRIENINIKNIEDIYEFELENREYFESVLPPRPEGYFEIERFEEIMKELIEEQLSGKCYMHIIRDDSGKIVGRVNLHSIEGEHVRKAELGYRIGKEYQGKGYASKAVKQVIEQGFTKYGLTKIEAGTSTENIGSQIVLLKNGFTLVGSEKKVMKINDKWVDGLLYSRVHIHNNQ